MSDEKKPPHIEYRLVVEKPYEVDKDREVECYDHLDAIIHGKDDADRLVKFLQENGYRVKMVRLTKTYLIDDKFPQEEEEPGSEAS